MTFQDFKLTVTVYFLLYWNNKKVLQYILGVLVALTALLLYMVYNNPTTVAIFFLILVGAGLVLTAIHYQNLKPGFPPTQK